MKRFFALFLVLLNFLSFLAAAEYDEGIIRLVLNESTGRFSLYTRANSQYEALFTDEDPRSSFISVNINDRFYKLGDTLSFRSRMGTDPVRPSFIFESPQTLITQEFSFIRIGNSVSANGVEMRITIENLSSQEVRAGFRFLLDTHLGEPGSLPHFYSEHRTINSETLITRGGNEKYWVSANNNLSFMGSINPFNGAPPDSVHLANWKRLNDVSWKLPFENGRNFNSPPYSIGDSAVCYYYEPRILAAGEKFTVSILLGVGNTGFSQIQQTAVAASNPAPAAPASVPVPEASASASNSAPDRLGLSPIQIEWDLAVLHELLYQIDEHLINEAVTEAELAAIEQTLEQLRIRYGMGSGASR
jgi:hypothetical protein